MQKVWVWLATTFLGFGALGAEFSQPMFNADVAVGYRHDNFAWNMSGLCDNPRDHWKMNWKGLEMVETTAQLSYVSCNNYYTRINGGWADILSGQASAAGRRRDHSSSDSSSSSNGGGGSSSSSSAWSCGSSSNCNCPDIYSRIKGNGNRGNAVQFQGAVGYQFTSNWRRVVVTPVIGYGFNNLHLEMHDATQVVNRRDDPRLLGPIPGLKVNYRPRIRGPFVGFDFLALVEVPCVILFGTAEYHWDQFYARGTWNLQDEFVLKYKQRASGHGIYVNLGFNYRFCPGWYIGAVGAYRNWVGHRGKHSTQSIFNNLESPHMAFGTMPVVPIHRSTKMHNISWNSWSASLSLAFRWYDYD